MHINKGARKSVVPWRNHQGFMLWKLSNFHPSKHPLIPKLLTQPYVDLGGVLTSHSSLAVLRPLSKNLSVIVVCSSVSKMT